MRILILFSILLALILVGGCSYLPFIGNDEDQRQKLPVLEQESEITAANHAAGDSLVQLLQNKYPADRSILVSTFSNLDNLQESSSLGRLIPQQISTSLTRSGLELIDVRLREKTVLVQESHGEFALSRKIKDVAQDNQAYAVLAGTYSVLYNRIYVNAKILRSSDGMTIAATDYFLPFNAAALDPEGFAGQEARRLRFVPNVHTSLD